MHRKAHQSFAVFHASHVGAVRRAAAQDASTLGFSAEDSAKVALLATELATNLVKHTQGGEVLLRSMESAPNEEEDAQRGIELIAMDKGRGISDVEHALQDGFSTAGSPGTGLGALRRLSHEFDIFSRPGHGTVVFCRFLKTKGVAAHPKGLEWGAVMLPRKGEEFCGDTWEIAHKGSQTFIMVADGLGHGPLAEEASKAATVFFLNHLHLSPEDMIRGVHEALKGSRGAVVAVAVVNPAQCRLSFAGLGNISASILDSGTKHGLFVYDGIAGSQMRAVKEIHTDFPKHGILILHSDGIETRWRFESYQGLQGHHPSVIAAILMRDFSRPADDAVVFVARISRGQSHEFP